MPRTYYQKLKRADRLEVNEKTGIFFDLINAFSSSKTLTEAAELLQDLMTANEITNLAVRLRIAKLLLSEKTYNEIHDETKASSATITKVGLWLQERGNGLRRVIERLPTKYNYPKEFPKGPIEFHLPQFLATLMVSNIANKQDAMVHQFYKFIELKKRSDNNLKKLLSEQFKRKG